MSELRHTGSWSAEQYEASLPLGLGPSSVFVTDVRLLIYLGARSKVCLQTSDANYWGCSWKDSNDVQINLIGLLFLGFCANMSLRRPSPLIM